MQKKEEVSSHPAGDVTDTNTKQYNNIRAWPTLLALLIA